MVLMIVVIITSCSLFVNTKELEENASVAFNEMKFDEFNKLYEKLEKADKEEAATYINNIKKHKYFIINAHSTGDALHRLEEIKKQVPVLSKLANKKIQAYSLIQTANKLDTIVMDGKQTGNYQLSIDTLDKLLEVQNKLEDMVSETNKNLTDLEDMNLNEYKDIQENLVGSVKDYRDKLQEKYMFYLNNSRKSFQIINLLFKVIFLLQATWLTLWINLNRFKKSWNLQVILYNKEMKQYAQKFQIN